VNGEWAAMRAMKGYNDGGGRRADAAVRSSLPALLLFTISPLAIHVSEANHDR
jgi:hypothetical protein